MNLMYARLTNRVSQLESENSWLRLALAVVLSICFIFVFGVWTNSANGQNVRETINFAGQDFELGISKREALKRLALCCKIDGSDDSYFVETKQSPFEVLGGIWFTNEKVSMLKKDAAQFNNGESVNLAQTLYRLLSRTPIPIPQPVVLEAGTEEGSNVTVRRVKLRFASGRSVVLEIDKVDANRSNLPDFTSVSEFLEKP